MSLKKNYFFIFILGLKNVSSLIANEKKDNPVYNLIQESIQIIERLDTNKRRTRTSPFYSLYHLCRAKKENYKHTAHSAHTLLSTLPISESIKKAKTKGDFAKEEDYYQLLNIISQLQLIDQMGIRVYNQSQNQMEALKLLLYFSQKSMLETKNT